MRLVICSWGCTTQESASSGNRSIHTDDSIRIDASDDDTSGAGSTRSALANAGGASNGTEVRSTNRLAGLSLLALLPALQQVAAARLRRPRTRVSRTRQQRPELLLYAWPCPPETPQRIGEGKGRAR